MFSNQPSNCVLFWSFAQPSTCINVYITVAVSIFTMSQLDSFFMIQLIGQHETCFTKQLNSKIPSLMGKTLSFLTTENPPRNCMKLGARWILSEERYSYLCSQSSLLRKICVPVCLGFGVNYGRVIEFGG